MVSLDHGIHSFEEYCNIPNFGHTNYRHEPINHDEYIVVLFYIGSKTPLHMNMTICFYIGCKPIIDDTYGYICWLCWAWTLKHIVDEMFCVGHGPVVHPLNNLPKSLLH